MGAHSDSRTFDAPSVAAAIKVAERLMADARYEDGHDAYAGHIGIARGIQHVPTKGPVTIDEARRIAFGRPKPGTGGAEWLPGRAEKWGPALLIQITNTGSRKRRWFLGAMCAS